MCTAVVLNYNDCETVIKYLENIKEYTCFEHIVIVDNCSTDDSYERLLQYKKGIIDVIKTEKNGGYGYGNNYGIRYAVERFSAKYILISNPDVIYEERTINALENILVENSDVGVTTALMKSPTGEVSNLIAWKIPTFLQLVFETPANKKLAEKVAGTHKYKDNFWKDRNRVEVECVPGSMLMVNAGHMITCGMYDENIFLYEEEIVLGIRMKNAGYRTILVTDSSYIHNHSVSISKTFKSLEKQRKLLWNSRTYILKKYYEMNGIAGILVKCYSLYNTKRVAISAFRRSRR